MARHSNKERILRCGMDVVRHMGLVGTSVRAITAAANVPLGSFGNHFASKEEFGLAVIDAYFADIREVVSGTLTDTSKDPETRVRSYFEAITERLALRGWHDGCLIGNTSVDSTETSEKIRRRLSEIFSQWREPLAECLTELAMPLPLPPAAFADFLMASWQGAILRMKVERSREPLERFMTVLVETWLRRKNP